MFLGALRLGTVGAVRRQALVGSVGIRHTRKVTTMAAAKGEVLLYNILPEPGR